jgi:hypothetical protein
VTHVPVLDRRRPLIRLVEMLGIGVEELHLVSPLEFSHPPDDDLTLFQDFEGLL